MRQGVVYCRADSCHLRRIALRVRRPRAVGVDLSGGFVWRVGDACTQAEPLERVLDDARRYDGRADDLAAVIRRRNVCDLRDGRDYRLLKLRLWMLAIVD